MQVEQLIVYQLPLASVCAVLCEIWGCEVVLEGA